MYFKNKTSPGTQTASPGITRFLYFQDISFDFAKF
jgi:hypothetical protein